MTYGTYDMTHLLPESVDFFFFSQLIKDGSENDRVPYVYMCSQLKCDIKLAWEEHYSMWGLRGHMVSIIVALTNCVFSRKPHKPVLF